MTTPDDGTSRPDPTLPLASDPTVPVRPEVDVTRGPQDPDQDPHPNENPAPTRSWDQWTVADGTEPVTPATEVIDAGPAAHAPTVEAFSADATAETPVPVPAAPPVPPPPVAAYTPAEETEPAHRPARMRTLVFGLMLLLVAILSLVATQTDAEIDPGVVVISALIGGGALLLLGAARSRT